MAVPQVPEENPITPTYPLNKPLAKPQIPKMTIPSPPSISAYAAPQISVQPIIYFYIPIP